MLNEVHNSKFIINDVGKSTKIEALIQKTILLINILNLSMFILSNFMDMLSVSIKNINK